MFPRHEPEVLVVGAGPVGLYAACALAQRGLDVQILDEEIGPAAHSYALALHPRSLELLEEIGLAPEDLGSSLRVDRLTFYDGASLRAEIRFSDLTAKYPYVLVLRQSHLETALEEALRRNRVRVQWLSRLTGLERAGERLAAHVDKLDKVSTGYPVAWMESETVRKFQLRPRLLVGADGHRSLVRRALKIAFPSVGDSELFGVFEFACEHDLDGEVRVVFTEGTVNVVWPLPEGKCRWSFQLLEEQQEPPAMRYKSRLAVQVGQESFPYLTPELLADLLRERSACFAASPGEVSWSALVRFDRRLAVRFGRDGVWLAGDAAHLTGPVGMQSMNVGLREAEDVAERLAGILRGRVGAASLEDYDRDAVREWRLLHGLERRPRAGEETDPWIREHRSRILPCLPASGQHLAALGRQLGLEISVQTPTAGTG